mgnify:CR=1 FL=1
MHHSSSGMESRQSLACMPVYLFSLLSCLFIRNLYIIWTVLFFRDCNYLPRTVYLFGPSVRGQYCNKCACVWCMSSNPTSFFPFIYLLMIVRLGHVSISIQYDSMFAFIHLFCMHRARRIILTAFVFQFQNWIHVSCSISYAMFRIAEPAIVAFCMCCIRHFCIHRIHAWISNEFLFWLRVLGEFLCFSILACMWVAAMNSMLTMRLYAYVI